MHVHFSYQHVAHDPRLNKAIESHVRKLDKFLARYSPDLIHLHGALEFTAAHKGPVCSLNLWLPTAQIHATQESGSALTALQACFNQLLEQVKKHKPLLRREGVWKRRRYKFQKEAADLQASEVRVQDRQQMRDYLELVLPQLEGFVSRELRYQEMGGGGSASHPQREEVVNEVVARAMENARSATADSVPYHRLIAEAVRILNGPVGEAAGHSNGVSQPQGPEPPDPVDLCLASMPPRRRQTYVLHALEGFSWEETAQVLELPEKEAEEIFRQVSGEVGATLRQSRGANRPPAPGD